MPKGSRASTSCLLPRSCRAMAYMPRSVSAKPRPSRRNRCSGGSQSLPVAQCELVALAQLPVVVDLAVGDQGGGAGEQRLVAGDEVDDREPRMRQRDVAGQVMAMPIRAAMRQRPGQRVEHGWRRGFARSGRARPARPHISGYSRADTHAGEECAPAGEHRRRRMLARRIRRGRRRRGARPGPGSASRPAMAAASASGSSGGTSRPVSPARISSVGPWAAAATTGRAADQASRMMFPKGSWREEQTKTSQAASSAPVSWRQPRKSTRSATPRLAGQGLQRRALRPLPADRQMGAGQQRPGPAAGCRSPCSRCSRPSASRRGAGGRAGRRGRRRRGRRRNSARNALRPAGQPWATIQAPEVARYCR